LDGESTCRKPLIFREEYKQRKETEITQMHLVEFETTIKIIKQYKRVPSLYPDTSILLYRIRLFEEGLLIYRMIKKDLLNCRVNGSSTHARQLVAVFQVLYSLYGLACVGYAQNSLEFFSHSPLIHVVARSFCFYTDSLFAQTGDSKDKCSSSLEVEC